MPVVLSQIFSADDRVYLDVEGSLYHYPQQYFSRITPYDRFIYYRPRKGHALRNDSGRYFGHGILGPPHPDMDSGRHRFVPILKYERFKILVPLRDPGNRYYETESDQPIQAQAAVRALGEIAYQRILAAAEMTSLGISLLPSTEEIAASSYRGVPPPFPVDAMRNAFEIPKGAGYVPHGDHGVDVHESAALQERAREDHQNILRMVHATATSRGASCWYNNNIDLLVDFGEDRQLIEAKSLSDLREAVNRMRYGIGQLMDYQVRYRSQLQGAQPILAFGRPPDRETSWIATVLQETGIGFISRDETRLLPLNDIAASSRLFVT